MLGGVDHLPGVVVDSKGMLRTSGRSKARQPGQTRAQGVSQVLWGRVDGGPGDSADGWGLERRTRGWQIANIRGHAGAEGACQEVRPVARLQVRCCHAVQAPTWKVARGRRHASSISGKTPRLLGALPPSSLHGLEGKCAGGVA